MDIELYIFNQKYIKYDSLSLLMKYKLQFIIFLFLIIMMPLSSAFLGYIETDECIQLTTISNSSTMTLSTVSPPGSLIILDVPMEKNGKTFNYSFCDTNVTGRYNYDFYNAEDEFFVNDFFVNPLGREFDDGQSNISLGILFGALVVGFLFLFIGLFLWTHEGNTALGFLFFCLSIIFGIYSLHLGYAYSSDLLFYESLTPVVSAVYITVLWLMSGIGIISVALLLIAMIKEIGKMNDTKQFGNDFDPISQTYGF